MNKYNELMDKWAEYSNYYDISDLESIEPGKFCLYTEMNASYGTCISEIYVLGFFINYKDALAFLRFHEIPNKIFWYVSGQGEKYDFKNFNSYIDKLDNDEKIKIMDLINEFDVVLKEDILSKEQISKLFHKFNEFFSETGPTTEIRLWGSILELLTDDTFYSSLDNDVPQLREIIDKKIFDEHNKKHMKLVLNFFIDEFSSRDECHIVYE